MAKMIGPRRKPGRKRIHPIRTKPRMGTPEMTAWLEHKARTVIWYKTHRKPKPRGPGRSKECRFEKKHFEKCPKENCCCRCHEVAMLDGF